MKGTKSAAKKSRKAKSFILTLALILLMGYFVMNIISLQLDRREQDSVLQQKTVEKQMIDAENERLQAVLDSDDKSGYIEQRAREKGYVMPGEKVFYDVTPGA